LTQSLLGIVTIKGTVFECCAGHGAIANELTTTDVERVVFAADINGVNSSPSDTYYGLPESFDATSRASWSECVAELPTLRWTITNPPFKESEKILPLAFEYSSVGVAFLLRLSYLEPCKRRAQWLIDGSDHLRYLIPVSPRPKFRADSGTDSVTVAWFVWLKDWSWRKLGVKSPFQFIRI
jgi:hypothetical protein